MFPARCLCTNVQTDPKHLLLGDTWLYILGMFTRKRQAKLVLKPKLGQRSAAVKNCSRQSKLLRKVECHVHRRQECLAYPIAHYRHMSMEPTTTLTSYHSSAPSVKRASLLPIIWSYTKALIAMKCLFIASSVIKDSSKSAIWLNMREPVKLPKIFQTVRNRSRIL